MRCTCNIASDLTRIAKACTIAGNVYGKDATDKPYRRGP
jgi:hypothetical protein